MWVQSELSYRSTCKNTSTELLKWIFKIIMATKHPIL